MNTEAYLRKIDYWRNMYRDMYKANSTVNRKLKAELAEYKDAEKFVKDPPHDQVCCGCVAVLRKQNKQLKSELRANGKVIQQLQSNIQYVNKRIALINNNRNQLQTELAKLNTILFHRENGLSHPDLQVEIDKSKFTELEAELAESKRVKKHIIEMFRQHIENKWNWSDEDVLYLIRKSVSNDVDYEALKGGEG